MLAINIEASHEKGMGHLFRMLNFVKLLEEKNEKYIFLINDNKKTKEILESNNINFEIVDLEDLDSNWEQAIIEKYNILYWINDRLDTHIKHANNIKNSNVSLITFDDLGSGAILSDINIVGLFFNKDNLEGHKILKGVEYLILNNEIDKYKRERKKICNIIVTLGGSDTYGVTIKVIKLLKKYHRKATIHIGPSFNHRKELEQELTYDYKLICEVPSLIEEFSKYDLAITGGGVTPFEANASGLPCLIIASEIFEIPNGKYLDGLGSSKFLGYYQDMNEEILSHLETINIQKMSQVGMQMLNTKALDKIYKELKIL